MNVEEAPLSIQFESIRGNQAESFALDQPAIRENMPVGSLIGQLVVTDPDTDEEITVVVSGKHLATDDSGCLTLTKVNGIYKHRMYKCSRYQKIK